MTRWGSKFESLILPLITIMFGFFLMEMGKIASKKESEKNNNNERVAMLSGLGALFVFNILTLFFLYVDFKSVKNLNDLPIDLYSMLFVVTGITLIVTGNYMPKCKYNSLIGLRTTWSMKNEITWAKSQKFGGICFILTGILMLFGNSLFIRGYYCIIYSALLMACDLIVSIIYTYYVSKISQ